MIDLIDEVFLIGFLASTIRLASPILLAALGEIFGQRSGILNLGIEGIMLMGALGGIVGAAFTNNIWLGIILGTVSGVAMGLLMAFLSVTFRVNQVLSGLSIYYLGLGLSTFLYRPFAPLRVTPLEPVSIPLLSQIPVIGPALFQQDALAYLTLILVPVFGIVLFRTTFGLKVKAVGENPKAADTLGINVYRTRYLCVILGGALAGLAGAYLPLALTGIFFEGMTVGRGFIAVAIVYFGKWSPYRTLVGGLVFGGAFALQIKFQALGVAIPYQFLLMLPYILTVVVLVIVSRKARGPASLGIPYERG